MECVRKTLSSKAMAAEDLLDGVNREVVPVLAETRRALNIMASSLGVLLPDLPTSGMFEGQPAFVTGYATVGDGGEGMFLWSTSAHTADGYLVIAKTGGYWVRLYFGHINVCWFGADKTGVANSTVAITTALAALAPGGALYFPAGTYLWQRGDGGVLADTIVSSNVRIYGDGALTVLRGLNAAGATPNNVGSELYNVFQATDRENIEISNMAFDGYTCPVAMYACSNILVERIYVNGLLANAGAYLYDKAVYLSKCTDVTVHKCKFLNTFFSVYLGGDSSTSCVGANIVGNHFRHTVAAGAFTATFPAGVYAYYSDDVSIVGNQFRDIYSSVDSGTTGTGMGFGVYEGDGTCSAFHVTGNTFKYSAKGSKRAIAIFVSAASQCSVTGNTITGETGSGVDSGIRLQHSRDDVDRIVTGNTISLDPAGIGVGVYCYCNHTTSGLFAISGNTIRGGAYGVRVYEGALCQVDVSNNTITASGVGVRMEGVAGYPLRRPAIKGNRIQKSQTHGIELFAYVLSPHIASNDILDGNTTAAAGNGGAAISFKTKSYGSHIHGNTIGNTPAGGGLFTYGIQNADAAYTARIYKDVVNNNSFVGLNTSGGDQQINGFPTASPTAGIFDVSANDTIENASISAAEPPRWHCVNTYEMALTADASSASVTITVASTTGLAAGDRVLLTKTNNPSTGGYYTDADWHIDTILLVTGATTFTITTGIPAGDGTYVSGTARVKTALFKGEGAIAA